MNKSFDLKVVLEEQVNCDELDKIIDRIMKKNISKLKIISWSVRRDK